MRNIFEVKRCEYIDVESYSIIKYYDKHNGGNEIVEDIESFINRSLTTADVIKFGSRSVFNYIDELFHEKIYNEEIEEYTYTNYLNLMNELIETDEYIAEFKDIMAESFDFNEANTQRFIKSLKLKCGVVGYSDWAFYLTYKEIDDNFIEDLFNGDNFYTISQLDEIGSVVDEVPKAHLKDVQDFMKMFKDNFGVGPYDLAYIVNNEEAIYNDLDKYYNLVDKISYYRFEEVTEF